ncbi:unnamed protein product [Musa acuminata subsp. malaccensis]|uniref:(wild Malaysian banana) hypothetical protein n=1 Tax=Musa acuminata subsp. malaccensis TaxID=214687 RepID=A0A804HRB2_MUSAM|nr:PREDICTED: uncharacterized protein LOC103986378 [Musa acuminata subsp. malaccensis]CAG1858824.1 unnamed protein product [Musa acuminata subsp. malaccensis]
MPLSQHAAAPGSSLIRGGKRRRGRSKGSRAKKKQKRLDSICDAPGPATPAGPQSPGDDRALIRRSSRVRRAPAFLDSSPAPARRRKKRRLRDSPIRSGSGVGGGRRRKKKRRKRRDDGDDLEEGNPVSLQEKDGSPTQEIKMSEEEAEDWRSRLRSRVGKRKGKSRSFEEVAMRKEKESAKPVTSGSVLSSQAIRSSRRGRRRGFGDEVSVIAEETGYQGEVLSSNDHEDSRDKASHGEEPKIVTDSPVFSEPNQEIVAPLPSEEGKENADRTNVADKEDLEQSEEGTAIPNLQLDDVDPGNCLATSLSEHVDDKPVKSEDILKEDKPKPPIFDDKIARKHVKEGRRCGLCGGGTDGRPPKRLVHESSGSDNEAYEGSSASEEPNYDVWDGFGDEPGWLGRLLGPINDRFGIPRIWVHQHCAVWSPEVYFAGLGCLKNVRAALCRGKALKCSRCGRPGATIGCRVDRCPKTYHLPCSRADGCVFDHRKFLIACYDHRHLFQPQGAEYAQQVKKMKTKKLKLEMRKLSHDAWRKDLEAEEKWLENCGEDEEFLKREGKRLHRDLLRIAPIYIGGSENEKNFQGWESVAGLQDVINCLKEVVILPLLYPEIFNSLGLTPPRGVLLHGYPGTGKTLVVRALIGACSRGDKRIAYFARKGADCLGKYVGDAERQLRLLFQVAERCQPSIIFFDEIDGLAPCRSRHQDQTHNSVVSTLLSLLDGLKSRGSVIVIGATNRPDAVDPALRRPGRFDREIYFPLPKLKDRSAILSLHTKSWSNPVSGPLLSWIANQTAGYAGADLQALCTQAAMNALKRNCALQALLSSAEKGFGGGKLPSLPLFMVEERDWLTALAAAPPPCSRREAGMAANDVVTSPLHSHLIPCLLKPLSKLLISFYIDERLWLPPAILKASESLKSVITAALEQKRLHIGFWWSHFDSLINQPSVANEIERTLCHYGLVTARSGYDHSYMLDDVNFDFEKFDSYRSKLSEFSDPSKSKIKLVELGQSSGFRALIAGTPRSGQQHLASCLLHGFSGHLEIQKVNLATMSQEGHGDIIHGLTQILLKCMKRGRCMIYMPRIDLWAIETLRKEPEYNDSGPETCKLSAVSVVNDVIRIASEAWNLFVEQVDSVTAPASLIIMATCEMQIHSLPVGIKKFFTNYVPDDAGSIPLEHTVPRFSVDVDGKFNHDLLISSCAAKLSEDLVQHYIQLIHHHTHLFNSHDVNETFQTMEAHSEPQTHCERQATLVTNKQMDPNQKASGVGDQDQQHVAGDQVWPLPSTLRGHDEIGNQHHSHQDSIPKTLHKGVKGGSVLSIATFGYQILRCPHFAELCWVTSKLKEGPCADVNGPWKRWPFNSCVMNTCSSPEKVVTGVNSNPKDRELSGTVRGLIAVGLLAYRGIYTSVREVSFEVRKVLELLVGQIRARISGRKDTFRYLRILSQVAYLEDVVNSWAYTFRSLPAESHRTAPNAKPTILGDAAMDIGLNENYILGNRSSVPIVPEKGCNELQDMLARGNPDEFVNDGEDNNLIQGLASQSVSTSDVCVLEKGELFPSAPCPSGLYQSSEAAGALPSGNGMSRFESPIVKSPETKDQSSGLEKTESNLPSVTNIYNDDSVVKDTTSYSTRFSNPCNDSVNVLSSNNAGFVTDELATATNFAHGSSSSLSTVSGISCLYCCCCRCLQTLFVLVRGILSDSWRSCGHCSRIDDIHDILASCSLNIVATIRQCFCSPSSHGNEESFGREQYVRMQSEHCACEKHSDKQLQKVPGHCSSSEVESVPAECVYHLRNKNETGTTDYESDSLAPVLKFFLKDGVLMPADPQIGAALHCRFDKLCLSSIVQMILLNKQHLD